MHVDSGIWIPRSVAGCIVRRFGVLMAGLSDIKGTQLNEAAKVIAVNSVTAAPTTRLAPSKVPAFICQLPAGSTHLDLSLALQVQP